MSLIDVLVSSGVVAQAELWLMETPNSKQPPVLVITRDEVIPVLNNIGVVPKTILTRHLGNLGVDGRKQTCQTLSAMAHC